MNVTALPRMSVCPLSASLVGFACLGMTHLSDIERHMGSVCEIRSGGTDTGVVFGLRDTTNTSVGLALISHAAELTVRRKAILGVKSNNNWRVFLNRMREG